MSSSLAFAVGPMPFEELLYKGAAVSFYGNANSQQQVQILEQVKRFQLAERMAQVTNASVRLRQNLGIGFQSCGNPNAFFDPQRSAIVFCLEMIELMVAQAKADTGLVPAEIGRTIEGAIWGIFFHELGHAVVGVNRVPITGREEDVADQFALYYAVNFIEPQNMPVVLPTIWFFKMMAQDLNVSSANQDQVKRLMADEHSLSDQRIYNLACWAYGAHSARGAMAANFVKLPQERGVRCSKEYEALDYGIKARFKKYFKPQR